MNETLAAELARILEASNWILLAAVTLDFLGLLATSWVIYLTRDTKLSVERVSATLERVARMDERGEEEFRKLSYYLFARLGPLETK